MELTGEQILPVPRERVWEALNDPAILKASVPGCESLENIEGNDYKVVMAVSVGPIKAKFNGKLKLSDITPPESYTLTFEGSGGAAGFGKGSAQVSLQAEGNSTRLVYSARAQVGGRLAQVGSRLVDGVARKMAEEFFSRFTAVVAPAGAEPASANTSGAMPDATPDTPANPNAAAAVAIRPAAASAAMNRMWLWGAGVVVVLVALVLYATH